MKINTTCSSFLLLFSICNLSITSGLLRNFKNDGELESHQRRKDLQQQTREPVECYITEMFGIAPPNKPHREPKLACTSINTDNDTDIYSISGNGVEEFFDGVDISDGNVKLFVPPDLITGFNIRINEHTMDEIDLELDEVMRRRLNIVNNKGNRQLLVIRVSNDSTSNMRVNQNAAQLRNDFFWDENNVMKRYNACSGGALNLSPYSGNTYGANNGVLEIKPNSNMCGGHWLDVWNKVKSSAGINFNSFPSNVHFMIVMPDCLNWEEAAGWGQTPGLVTWFPTQYTAYPISQVHELGHNFGHRHSGKGGIPYADDTGMMGNRGSWSDQGTRMCFNPPKTYWFDWFKNKDITASAGFQGTIVGPSAKTSSDYEPVVVRILAENGNNKDLYVMLNSASGANDQVVGNRNQVLITEQESPSGYSVWQAGLSPGNSFTKSNWNGKTLVVKHCGVTSSSGSSNAVLKVSIAIGYSGSINCSNNAQPPTQDPGDNSNNNNESNNNVDAGEIPSIWYDNFLESAIMKPSTENIETQMSELNTGTYISICKDMTGWYDNQDPEFNCEWYTENEERCNNALKHPNFGHSARTACCACGGGEDSLIPDMKCEDEVDWTDNKGKNCNWYSKYGSRCDELGDRWANDEGKTANEACCFCKKRR